MRDIQEFSCLSFLLSFCYNGQSENLEISKGEYHVIILY